MRVLPAGFVAPCLPIKAQQPPSGEAWLHEIKHDGFRVIARKRDTQVRLYSRPGNDLTYRFPLIVETLARLRPRSCIIDGEAVAREGNGMPSFDRIRYRRHDASVFLYAFDLIELNGDDLRREPLDTRKATLASVLRRAAPGLRLNEHIEADGPTVFAHACKMGLEASCRSARPRRTARVARPTGSRARTRLVKRAAGRRGRLGAMTAARTYLIFGDIEASLTCSASNAPGAPARAATASASSSRNTAARQT